MEAFLFLSSLRRSQALMRLLGHRQTYLFEYFTVQDTMVIHNKDMTVWRKIEHYLGGDQSIRQGQLADPGAADGQSPRPHGAAGHPNAGRGDGVRGGRRPL